MIVHGFSDKCDCLISFDCRGQKHFDQSMKIGKHRGCVVVGRLAITVMFSPYLASELRVRMESFVWMLGAITVLFRVRLITWVPSGCEGIHVSQA
jgi:hypothetical protein